MNETTVPQQLDMALQAERCGRFSEARDLLRAVVAEADGTLALGAGLRLGRLCALGGAEYADEGERVLRNVREQATARGASRQEAESVHLLALVERARGNLEEAWKWLNESSVLSESSAPGPETAQLFHYRGLLTIESGELANAERMFFRAHQLYNEAGYAPGRAEVCDSLAGLLLRRGKTGSALAFCQRSLELKRELGDRYGEAIALGTLGRIRLQQARYEAAAEAFQGDLEIARELEDQRGVGQMLNSLGEVRLLQGDHEAALQRFAESLQEDPSSLNQAHGWLGTARAHLAAENVTDAATSVQQLAAILAPLPAMHGLQACLDGMQGCLAWRDGEHDRGERLLKSAIKTLRQRSQALETIPFLYELRDLYQSRDEMARAVAVMTDALDLLSECGADCSVDDVEAWLRSVDHPRLTRMALERHLPEVLVDRVLGGELTLPPPIEQVMTILFTDIRGYTRLSEGLPPVEVVELLNDWFSEATRSIQRHGGVVDKFIGDAVMALFGLGGHDERAAAGAVRAALEIRDELSAMNLRQQVLGRPELHVGIGIATGTCVVGCIGSHFRQSYTAIGNTVNTASRLESVTRDFPGCDILIDQQTENAQQSHHIAESTFQGEVQLKGKQNAVPVFQVRGASHAADPASHRPGG
jgi:class 3 adenylate cyclase/tetratricopeptide (TPR) repeat protein